MVLDALGLSLVLGALILLLVVLDAVRGLGLVLGAHGLGRVEGVLLVP